MAEHENSEDRNVMLSDMKQRIIRLLESQREAPSGDIYEGEIRYYKANKEWIAILHGWLSWAADVAFWKGAEDESFHAIQQTLKYLEGIDMPIEDCEDVENCIESSVTITNIQNSITNIENNITNLEECCETVPDEGSQFPPPPPFAEADTLCKSATYIASQLATLLLDVWNKANTLTLQEFLSALLGTVWYDFSKATPLWQFALTIADPTLASDAIAFTDNIVAAFFCAEGNKVLAIDNIQADSAITANEKALWISIVEMVTQGQIDTWSLVGGASEIEEDCSNFCNWTVVYDFDGTYIPDGTEAAIYGGDTFDVVGGNYVEGQGYIANAASMVVSKNMPPQCKIRTYRAWTAKTPACAAVDVAVWQKDATGGGVEQWSAESRNLSNTPVMQTFTVPPGGVGAVLSAAKVKLDAFFCGGATSFSHKITRLVLVGKGALPQN